jgi:hypothetical protein
MATSRDFVYDEQGEMLPSDSAAAAARRKELDDDARMVSDAKDAAKAPAPSAKMPTRPGQGAKPKSGIVTKEQLAKSGFDNLRDYMNAQKGLKRRDGAAPKSKTTPPAATKPAAPSGNVANATPAEKPKALAISSGVLKQRESDEKRREERREFGRQRDAKEKAEKEKKREAAKSMSPSERSAARGKAVKEFFGINTKKPLDAKGATIQSMDTDMMRAAGRAAAKEQGQKRKVESGYKKGGSVSSASKRADGIAQRGKTRGKVY